MKHPQKFICDDCNQIKTVEWDDWSDQVLVMHLAGKDFRICKECQDQNISLKKNIFRMINEKMKGETT